MIYRYCVEGVISVALSAGKIGYQGIHGHDVNIRVCIETHLIIDLEALYENLNNVLKKYDHKNLDEVLGRGAIIEDLLHAILDEMRKKLNEKQFLYNKVWGEARVPHGIIIVLEE